MLSKVLWTKLECCLQISSLAQRLQEIAEEDYTVYHRVAAAARRGVSVFVDSTPPTCAHATILMHCCSMLSCPRILALVVTFLSCADGFSRCGLQLHALQALACAKSSLQSIVKHLYVHLYMCLWTDHKHRGIMQRMASQQRLHQTQCLLF